MKRLLVAAAIVGALAFAWFAYGWYGPSNVDRETAFTVPDGATLTSVARKLEDESLVGSADGFLLRAKILGSGDPVQRGEFAVPAGASAATILDTLQHGQAIRRFVTVPEGLPSIMVYDRLMAEPLLTGPIPVAGRGHGAARYLRLRARRCPYEGPRADAGGDEELPRRSLGEA